MTLQIGVSERATHDVVITRNRGTAVVWIDGVPTPVIMAADGRATTIEIDNHRETIYAVVDRDRVFVHAFGRSWTLTVTDPVEVSLQAGGGTDTATAPMPGVLLSVSVGPGDDVADAQVIAVIESMKMQTEIRAPRAGVVDRVLVSVGGNFDGGEPLISLVPPDGDGEGA